jgi:Na+-translocating ferredoxin:NAD+ oxidoreductase RNF subunit RnfB
LQKSSLRSAPHAELEEKASRVLSLLPQRDCGACGYESCYDLAIAIAEGREKPDACRIAGKKVAKIIEDVLKE